MYHWIDMRLTNALDPVLGTSTKVRLLRSLLASDRRGRTGRELARQARVSTAQSARDLRDLAEVGIVNRTVSGRSYTWRLNEDHVLFEPLRSLFSHEAGLRDELVRRLSKELRSAPVARARLFGSFARGDERSDSDIDVYIELRSPKDRERVQQSVARLRDRVWSTFGNPVSALVYTRDEARHPRNPDLMVSIRRDGVDLTEEWERVDVTN
jgi:predicted nucleotidyltransferase